MAEKTNAQNNNVQALKHLIEYNELTGDEVLSFVTHVIHVSRYLSDPLHISQTGLDTANVIDVYQLTVTDGQSKRKVLLDPELARIVQSGQIKEGSSIRLEKCSVKYDETDLQQRTFIIVHKLTLLDVKQLNLTYSDCTDMPWCDDCDDVEKSSVPLSSSRGYFLNTWSSMEMDGDVWKKGNPEMYNGLGSLTPIDLYTIKEMSIYWRSLKCPPILVKILSKKRVLHYAKPSKNDKWPLQTHFTVCDRTGCATLVLWNSLCPEYYHRLQEGHILLIQKFTVKKSYHPINNTKCEPTIPDHLQMYDIDININSHHPVGEIRVISPTAVPACLKLPTIQYNFVQRKDIGCFPSNYICDITGVVTHVGRFHREKITGKSGNDLGGFWISRWLELRDNTSSRPFIIHIYRAAEIDVHDQLHPGMVIILRHMRIVHNVYHITSSRGSRTVYLTSTGSTCVSKATDNFVSRHVEDVVAWATSITLDYTMGGYYSYPPLPTSLSEVRLYYEGLQITTSEYIQSELDNLRYREQRRLFVQCRMVYVKYCSATNRIEETTQDDKKLLDVVVNEGLYKYFKEQISETEINLPYLYKYNEQHIHDLLQFTSLFKNVEASDLDLADGCSGCFIIFWSGLNTKVLIPTIWMYSDVITQENRLKNMLNHSCKSLQRNQALSQEEITHILSSSKECDGHRFLVILDVFRSQEKQTEIVLNTAYNT